MHVSRDAKRTACLLAWFVKEEEKNVFHTPAAAASPRRRQLNAQVFFLAAAKTSFCRRQGTMYVYMSSEGTFTAFRAGAQTFPRRLRCSQTVVIICRVFFYCTVLIPVYCRYPLHLTDVANIKESSFLLPVIVIERVLAFTHTTSFLVAK